MPARRRTLVAVGVVTAMVAATASATIAPSVFAAAPSVTLTVNPWYAGGSFSGWGTTLGQWANATAEHPAATREELHRLLFTAEGLDLTAARYVIGAGDASDAPDDLAHGADLDGWWIADADGSAGTYGGAATTLAAKAQIAAAFRAAEHLDADADATQRWWIDRLKNDITYWEAGARSAPYFMTESGRVSGNGGWANQLTPAQTTAYAEYLLAVSAKLEAAHGIDLAAVSPFYEPNTPQWNNGGPLEGMRVEAWFSEDVIQALDTLKPADLQISGPDDTSPFEGKRNWTEWAPETRAMVDVYTTHSDATTDARYFADIAASHDASLAMTGWVPANALADDMAGGLDLATRLAQDLRDLQPERWILDQAVIDPQAAAGQTGVIGLDLDDTSGASIQTGSGFDVLRNYTNFIEQGSRFVGVDNNASVAALDADGEGVSIVHPNTAAEALSVTLDLTGFAEASGATVTPYVTNAEGAVVAGEKVAVAGGLATVEIPARSVVTFQVDGVSGVSASAPQVNDGDDRVVQGVHSNKPLTFGAAGRAASVWGVASTTARAAQQQLTFHEVEVDDRLSRRAFVIADGAGNVLGSGPDLRRISVDEAKADRSTVWFLRSIDGGRTFNIANAATAQALDVQGWGTADGTPVVPYFNNAASNQQFRIVDTAPRAVVAPYLQTAVGVRATLPSTIDAQYAWGSRSVRDVTWTEPALTAWDDPAVVEIDGTGTDVWGNEVAVTARVVVGEVTVAEAATMTTFAGSTVELLEARAPRTVEGRVAGSDTVFATPVRWDFSDVDAAELAEPGLVTVSSVEGSVEARLTIEVVAAEHTNVLASGVRGHATFSEPGFHPDDNNGDLNDGNRTNKGWSNWFGGGRNAEDRVSFYFDQPQLIDAMTAYDGPEGDIREIRFQYRDMRGGWIDVPTETVQPISVVGTRFITTVEFTPVLATAMRVIVTANNTHMTLSELEVQGLRAAATR